MRVPKDGTALVYVLDQQTRRELTVTHVMNRAMKNT